MATQYYNTPIAHTNDTDYRTWVGAVHTALVAAGLQPTADTGQVDPSTATRPGANQTNDYKIYFLNDSLHGTAPIYIKIYFGTGSNTAYPAMSFQIAQGTDGSGGLTGVTTTKTSFTQSSSPLLSTTIDYPSYVCVNDGFFGFGWKSGAVATLGIGFLSVQRTCDDSGEPDSYGCAILYNSGSVAKQTINFTTSTLNSTTPTTADFCMIPGGVSSTLIGLDPQVLRHQFAYPRFKTGWATLTALQSEVLEGVEFETIPIGALTPRNYICLGYCARRCAVNSTNTHICMLWE